VFWMGLYPESFLKPMRADIGRVVQRMERVAPAGDSRPTPGKPVPAAHDEAAH
jgi:NADH-quinone oxidoreductase subunit M